MKILLGDIRPELAKDLQRRIVEVIDQNKHKESYYILVYANLTVEFWGNTQPVDVIKTKIILLSKKPKKMLGTMLAYVDNRKGIFKWIWNLPLDIPTIIEPSDEVVESVWRSAIGMPILNS